MPETLLDHDYANSVTANERAVSEVIHLEAQIPGAPAPKPDVAGESEKAQQQQAKFKTKTVELPEVQAIRQAYQEHVSKIGTGELALAEVGKAGRKAADAIHPGVVVAGRAMGLDEEGANALATGMVEFLAGLPGGSESDTSAGIETALAALPMVGAMVKSGKVFGKAITLYRGTKKGVSGDFWTPDEQVAKAYAGESGEVLKQEKSFNNVLTAQNWMEAKKTLSLPKSATMPELIEAAKHAGYDALTFKGAHGVEYVDLGVKKTSIGDEFRRATGILKSERGSVPVGGGKDASPVINPIEAAHQKTFEDSFKGFNEELTIQRQGVRSDVQVTAESRSPQALQMEAFLNLKPGTILKDSNVVAAKRLFRELTEPIRIKASTTDHANDQSMTELLQELQRVRTGTIKIAGVFAEPPRSTRLLNKELPTTAPAQAETPERVRISDPYIQQWLQFFKEQDELASTGAPALTREKLVQVLAGMKTPEEFIAAAKALEKPSKWDMFIEYWINGLLSGPQTHATNILSNAATIAWGIPERAVASMFSREVRPSEPVAMMAGILEAQGDAWRLAWQAFKAEESQLGLGKLETHSRAITADALELTGVPGRAVDFLGTMIRLPGRTLLAADDYFKSIAYRAELRALAKREAFRSGGSRSQMRQIEERILASPPESIDDAAKEYASYVTFTRDLGEAGQRVQALANTPVGRIVLPFVRTPTNIFKYFGERTPLAFASQAVREEISAGGSRRALALAKISLGAMTMSYMGTLAAEGIITGGGPKDKALRAEMMATGWQPYSFKIGDTYYKYGRIEPLGSLIGMAADAADLLGQLPQEDAEKLGAALVVAISRNVAQKTFVKGVAGTLNAVASQDMNVVKAFLEQELPTILPYSTAMGQVARFNDPVLHEVNSVLDAFKAKVPGYSDTLPPRRNLWGEAIALEGGLGPDMISPIYTTTQKIDLVSQELVRLKLPIGMPGKSLGGVPLTPQEYDAFVVLQGGKPILNDMTLKHRLADTMQTDLYKRASDGPDGGKKVLIQQWVSSYRDMARHILSDKELSQLYGFNFPDLRDRLHEQQTKDASKFSAVP